MGIVCGAKRLADTIHQTAIHATLNQSLSDLSCVEAVGILRLSLGSAVQLSRDLANDYPDLLLRLFEPYAPCAEIFGNGIDLRQSLLPWLPSSVRYVRACLRVASDLIAPSVTGPKAMASAGTIPATRLIQSI